MHPQLQQLGEDALGKMDDDVTRAKAYLVQQLLTDQTLFQEYINPIVEQTVEGILNYIMRQRRFNIRHSYESNLSVDGSLTTTHISTTRESPPSPLLKLGRERLAKQTWMHYPMMNGRKVLGDMVKPELQVAALWYLTAGKTNMITGKWLVSIARVLKDDTTPVKAVLNEATLQKLRERTEKAVA